MIGYSDKQNNSEDYENYSLSLSILRTDYDRILDHTIKKTILCGKLRQLTEMFGDDFVYDTAITSVQETIGTLSELRGVFILHSRTNMTRKAMARQEFRRFQLAG